MPYSDQVDAGPVREHLRALLKGGMTVVQIQNLSGVNRTAIRVILGDFPNRKPSVQVRAETASRILRTRLDPSSAIEGLVPAVGTVRRLRALRAMGWTNRALADRLGYPSRQLQIGQDVDGWVNAANAERVRELYAELADVTPPPSRAATRARRTATAAGWLPPIWWDDDSLDARDHDPIAALAGAVVLDEVAVHRIMSGTLRIPKHARSPELVEAIRRLAALGLPDADIAERVGMTRTAVTAVRLRNAIPTGIPSNRTTPPSGPRPAAREQIVVIAPTPGASEDGRLSIHRRAHSA